MGNKSNESMLEAGDGLKGGGEKHGWGQRFNARLSTLTGYILCNTKTWQTLLQQY